LGLHTEFSSSTHDALLGVVVGASRLESQQQPDAWGVAEKQQQQQSQNTQVQALQQQPQVDPSVVTKVSVDIGPHEGRFDKEEKVIINTCNESNNGEQIQDQERNNDDSLNEEFRTSNWTNTVVEISKLMIMEIWILQMERMMLTKELS